MSMRHGAISALALAAAAMAAACSGKAKQDPAMVPDNRPARRATLAWGTTPAAPAAGVERTDVYLQITDENGAAQSYPLGTFDGTCSILGPQPQYQALTAITCLHDGAGLQLHAAAQPSAIVVMRMMITPGKDPDPLSREEVTSIPVPLGAKVDVTAQ